MGVKEPDFDSAIRRLLVKLATADSAADCKQFARALADVTLARRRFLPHYASVFDAQVAAIIKQLDAGG